jgi:hypothetical protein
VVAQLGRERLQPWRSIRIGGAELHDGGTGEPELRGNASADSPSRSELLVELERLAPWPASLASPALSSEEEQNLRAMGYLD